MNFLRPTPIKRTLAKPPALKAGDQIALVAPASPPLAPEVIARTKERLETLGFRVIVGKRCTQRTGFLAGSDRERLFDLHAAFSRSSVKAIFCVRGGYGVGRILASLDFKRLAAQPKIVVGCSDVTALLCGGLVRAGTVMFHGPMGQSLVDGSCPDYTLNSLLVTLMKRDAACGSIVRGYDSAQVEGLRRGKVTGQLIGGNLAVLLSLLGTPFFPSLKNKIVCLEDVSEKPYRIDRMLTQLLSVGAFDEIAGFAFGSFRDCEYAATPSLEKMQTVRDVLVERLYRLGKPIVLGLPFGHNPHNCTLPLGVRATLDGTRGDLIIEEFGVR
jgi:muramoyltetrapeptide carboxypeptidase